MLKQSLTTKLMAKVDKNLTEEFKDKHVFAEKLQWAKDLVKGRDILKEMKAADKKEKVTKL